MMFDVPLFLLISAFSIVALVVVVPRLTRSILTGRTDITVSVPVAMVGATVQQMILAVGLAAAGTALAPKTGLSAPWFAAVSHGEGLAWEVAAAQLPTALLVGALTAAAFLLLYYKVFRPRMSDEEVSRTENFRLAMGLSGRLLMGGVAEEVMFRWGVMSILAWLAIGVFGIPAGPGMWAAILVSGLLFGLGHIPGVLAVGLKITKTILVAAISLNMVVSLAFGWLFWQYGLLAAMVAHALLHAVWHPLERRARSEAAGPVG